MFFTIYKITNVLNGKIYIGKHQTKVLDDTYYGSGKLIKAAIKKYGKENFTKEILYIFETEDEMNSKEKELITEEFASRNDTYNTGIGGEGGPHFKGRTHGKYMSEINESEDHRNKISEGLKKYYKENENARKGLKRTDQFKNKLSEYRTGKNHSDFTKQTISDSLKGRKHSEETKRKMREAKQRRKDNLSGPVV